MEDHPLDAQPCGQAQVGRQRLDPFLHIALVLRGEIRQINPVDEIRPDPRLRHTLTECRHGFVVVLLPAPALWRRTEDLHRLRPDLERVDNRFLNAARRRYMRADARQLQFGSRIASARAAGFRHTFPRGLPVNRLLHRNLQYPVSAPHSP